MADNLEIRLDIRTLQQAVQAMSQVAQQTERIDRASTRFVGGPNQRFVAAQASLARASAMGNAPAAADARLAMARAQRQMQQQTRSTTNFIQRIEDASNALGRLGLHAAAVAGTVGAYTKLVAAGGAAFEARGILGGSARDFGRLQALGGAAGVSASDLPALAAAFRERTGGGVAAGAFGFAPGREVAPGFDEMRHVLRGIDRVLNAPTEARARELTKIAPELEQFLKLRQMSPGTREAIRRQIEFNAAMADSGRNALDASINVNRLNQSWERLGQSVATSREGSAAIRGMAGAMDRVGEFMQAPWWSKAVDIFRVLTFQPPLLHPAGSGGGSGTKSVQQQQVEATERNTAALEAMRKDWLNGGPRATGAIPSRLRGQALDRALENGLKDLGATTF